MGTGVGADVGSYVGAPAGAGVGASLPSWRTRELFHRAAPVARKPPDDAESLGERPSEWSVLEAASAVRRGGWGEEGVAS